jgi:hypothetical protein
MVAAYVDLAAATKVALARLAKLLSRAGHFKFPVAPTNRLLQVRQASEVSLRPLGVLNWSARW